MVTRIEGDGGCGDWTFHHNIMPGKAQRIIDLDPDKESIRMLSIVCRKDNLSTRVYEVTDPTYLSTGQFGENPHFELLAELRLDEPGFITDHYSEVTRKRIQLRVTHSNKF